MKKINMKEINPDGGEVIERIRAHLKMLEMTGKDITRAQKKIDKEITGLRKKTERILRRLEKQLTRHPGKASNLVGDRLDKIVRRQKKLAKTPAKAAIPLLRAYYRYLESLNELSKPADKKTSDASKVKDDG